MNPKNVTMQGILEESLRLSILKAYHRCKLFLCICRGAGAGGWVLFATFSGDH